MTPGDFVLAKYVGIRCQNTMVMRWKDFLFIAGSKPFKDLPVYIIVKGCRQERRETNSQESFVIPCNKT